MTSSFVEERSRIAVRVDLGSGTGVLTYLAARTAEHVYAIELDSDVYAWSKRVLAESDLDNVTVINDDVRDVSLPERADVIICEMLDTALITELQVPVMNYAVAELLADGGTTIPHRTKTTAQLVESDYDFLGKTFPLPHYEAYGSRESIARSEEVAYHTISFDRKNETQLDERLAITASKPGRVNGVRLKTYTQFGEDQDYLAPTDWLNPPLVLPTDRSYRVEPGDELEVTLEYALGGNLGELEYTVDTI